MKKVVKVLFGIPNEGNTLCDAYENRLAMMQWLGAFEIMTQQGLKEYDGKTYDYPEDVSFQFALGTVGNILTPVARERLAETAVENGFDYLFMVDDDMICPNDLFLQLWKHKKDIIAPLAFMRFAPHKPVIYVMEEGFDAVVKKDYYTCRSWIDYPRDQLVECDATGFGAVLIDTGVLKSLSKPWFTAATGKGEDIQFCYEARKRGFKVFVDTATKLGHLGPPINVDEAYFDEYKHHLDEYKQTVMPKGLKK